MIRRVMFSLLVVWSIVSASASAEEPFRDSFLNEKLGTGWRWVRENQRGGQWRLDPRNGLEIRSTPTSIYRRTNTSPNLLIRPVDLDATVEISVTATIHPTHPGEQGGLMFYFDDDNYAKLVIEELSDKDQPIALVFFTEENGGPGRNRHGKPVPQPGHSDRRRLNDNEIRHYLDVPSNKPVTLELKLRVQKTGTGHMVNAFWRRPGKSKWNRVEDPPGRDGKQAMRQGHVPEHELRLPQQQGTWYAGILTMFGGEDSHWQSYRNFSLRILD